VSDDDSIAFITFSVIPEMKTKMISDEFQYTAFLNKSIKHKPKEMKYLFTVKAASGYIFMHFVRLFVKLVVDLFR